ncbi:MAG TPA: helix-turn-helix transcriptional regulator [Stellaceae bacterium]|nr:helix-turn-helix transcriptional regulator [Stellaceae bacterium]
MDVQALVAWNLRRIRVDRGFSQERLALDAGIDLSYVNRLERVLENPTVAVLDRLTDALGANIAELFEAWPSNMPRPQPLRSGRRPKR